MAKTTFQEVWNTFVDFTGVVSEDLPQTEEGMYALIKSGILKYNSVTEASEIKLIGNEMTEELNVELDYDRLLLLSYCNFSAWLCCNNLFNSSKLCSNESNFSIFCFASNGILLLSKLYFSSKSLKSFSN